jgi:hypothetical protein
MKADSGRVLHKSSKVLPKKKQQSFLISDETGCGAVKKDEPKPSIERNGRGWKNFS